jgi:hypothetical protein
MRLLAKNTCCDLEPLARSHFFPNAKPRKDVRFSNTFPGVCDCCAGAPGLPAPPPGRPGGMMGMQMAGAAGWGLGGGPGPMMRAPAPPAAAGGVVGRGPGRGVVGRGRGRGKLFGLGMVIGFFCQRSQAEYDLLGLEHWVLFRIRPLHQYSNSPADQDAEPTKQGKCEQ